MIITKNQIKVFDNSLEEIFLENAILALEENFRDNIIFSFDHIRQKSTLVQLMAFGKSIGLQVSDEFEYFFYLCFKFNISLKILTTDKEFEQIFRYPDRSNEDKLFGFHYYLEYDRNDPNKL